MEKDNQDLVHHMEVFHCEAPVSEKIPRYEGPCHAADRPSAIDQCKRVLAAWAMGAMPLVYPQVSSCMPTLKPLTYRMLIQSFGVFKRLNVGCGLSFVICYMHAQGTIFLI